MSSSRSTRTPQVNGNRYLRSLAFAFRACPKADDGSLTQVVFVEHHIVCADGRRWHVGHLPEEAAQPHVVVATRDSIKALLALLEGFRNASKGNFFVEQDGLVITVRYHEKRFVHELDRVQIGHTPSHWTPPVGPATPEVHTSLLPEILCGHVKDVAAWGKDKGTFRFRHDGGAKSPVAIEIHTMGEHVASAYLVPADAAPAILAPHDPLFEGVEAGATPQGGSILQLSLEALAAAPAKIEQLDIDGIKIDVTGIPDGWSLLALGPCAHKTEAKACADCTATAVAAKRADMAKEAKKVVRLDSAKGKPGAKGKGNGGKPPKRRK